MSKVNPKRLGDLITLKRGYDLPEKDRTPGPYPVISSAGVSGCHNEYKVEGQGVVTGRYGTLGEMYYVDGKYWPHNTALYVQNFKGNDPKYIYYLLSCIGRIRTSDKSAVPGVNRNELHEMAVPAIEDKNLQVALRTVLEDIDKKIELNNRINAELEAMAKTLYDYWFVQFDFPDDSPQGQGKLYKISGGKMVYNPTLKREIPEGWEDSTIGAIESNIVTGKTPSKGNPEYFGGNVPFITIGDIRGNTYVVSTEETLTEQGASTQKNKFLPEDSICVTCIASPGLVGFVTKPAQTNQQINSVVCSNEIHKYYLYFAIKSYFERAKAKTGNTFSNMNKGDFSAIGILKPSDQVLQDYHQKAHPLFEQIKLKSLENKQLIKLRDWLLPMLMNGQVTVKN